MKLILLLVCSLLVHVAWAQSTTKAEIKNVDFEVKNNKLICIYDIVNSNKDELFTIALQIRNAKGEKIIAQTCSGDIDSNVTAGFNKKIMWDLIKDKVILNDSISVKIIAKPKKKQ